MFRNAGDINNSRMNDAELNKTIYVLEFERVLTKNQ